MKKDIKQEQDKILYKQFLDGDMSAFGTLVMKYKNNLLYFIFKYVKQYEVAEDIFQDTITYLLSKKEIYNFNYSFKTFLYTIAKSRALNYIRQSKMTDKFLEETDEIITEQKLLEEIVIENEVSRQIKQVILKMKKDYQIVIFLALIENLSYSEIAIIMNKNESQIKNLVHRARIKLRTLLIEEKIVEIRNNNFIKLISIILIISIVTSGIVYAGITIYKSHIERKIEVTEPTTEEIKYSMQNGGEFVKIGKTIAYADAIKGNIYIFNLENNQAKKLCSINGVKKIYFDGEHIYAIDTLEKGIFKIDLLGNIEKIYDGNSLQLLITENEIYFVKQVGYDYINNTPQGNIYKMDKNGNNVQLLIENIKHYFYVVDNYIYYIDKDTRSVYRADIDGQNKIQIAKGRNTINAVTDKYLAYTDNSCYINDEIKYPFIKIIFFDTNEQVEFDNPKGFYTNGDETYFYTSSYGGRDFESINKLFSLDIENNKIIEKWRYEDEANSDWLFYVYNENAYFSNNSTTVRLNINNKNEKENMKFNTTYFLDGKAYEFSLNSKIGLNIFELDNLKVNPVMIRMSQMEGE